MAKMLTREKRESVGVLVRDGGRVATSRKLSCKHKASFGNFMKLKLRSESDKETLAAMEYTIKWETCREDLRTYKILPTSGSWHSPSHGYLGLVSPEGRSLDPQ